MIFAKYIGPQAPSWTPGKIYFAMHGFEDKLAVDVEDIRLQDDAGSWQEVKTKAGLFSFPSCVYAACVKAIGPLKEGEVVKVCNVSDEFLNVSEHGYLQADHFEILDLTNVAVGNKVQDKGLGDWETITLVDDEMNIGTKAGGNRTWPVELFCFPVGNNGILSEPLLKCVKEVPGELTEGKTYSPLKTWDGLVELVNDAGKLESYMLERFANDL